jgi:hypothetical protein
MKYIATITAFTTARTTRMMMSQCFGMCDKNAAETSITVRIKRYAQIRM